MLWLDKKYIGLISPRLNKFAKRDEHRYQFRCPFCGDSAKNENKARGWFYEKQGKMLYYCHNCGAAMDIKKFIRQVDPTLYNEYVKEVLKSEGKPLNQPKIKTKPPVFIKKKQLDGCPKVSELDHDHVAYVYLKNRHVPEEWFSRLHYTPTFKAYVNTIIKNKFETTKNDDERLLIPFYNTKKELIGFQGRALGPSKLKYITIILNETEPKVFNLDRCDRSRPHIVLEGPIDSMFMSNSIAMTGGSIDDIYINENSIIVYDNEPRSKETCYKIQKAIDHGYQIALFDHFNTHKDINDMVLGGYISTELETALIENAYSGLKAQLNFDKWKRI